MSDVIINEQNLTDIADAIRYKLGVETEYMPREMSDAIRSIEGGGTTYQPGDGIDITNNVISVDNTIARTEDLPDISNAYQTTDDTYSYALSDNDMIPVKVDNVGKRKISFATLKNSIADHIWNWLVTNKTTADKDISTVGQKIADAKGLYDLNGLISNINGNAVEWTSGTTTGGSYRMYNGNLWYCIATTTTAPSAGNYWMKVNEQVNLRRTITNASSINELNTVVNSLKGQRLVVHQYSNIVSSQVTTIAGNVVSTSFTVPTPIAGFRHVALLWALPTSTDASPQAHLNWCTIIHPTQVSGNATIYISSFANHTINRVTAYYLDEIIF